MISSIQKLLKSDYLYTTYKNTDRLEMRKRRSKEKRESRGDVEEEMAAAIVVL